MRTNSWRTHKDNRTRKHRLDQLWENWAPLMGGLVQAYLVWRSRTPVSSSMSELPHSPSSWDFNIKVVDIYTLKLDADIRRAPEVSVAEGLVLNGYLGTSPLSPSFAVSLKTLELYRRLRLRKPSFSVEAFAKVICDFYAVGVYFLRLAPMFIAMDFRYLTGNGTGMP